MDCNLPKLLLSVGILQARILEWVACLPPGDFPDPGIEPGSLGRLFEVRLHTKERIRAKDLFNHQTVFKSIFFESLCISC